MASVGSMRRWERWACEHSPVLDRSRASYAVSRLANELRGDRALWAASALVRAARPDRSAAGQALQVLIEGCADERVAGKIMYECLLHCGHGEGDVAWSAVAAPVLLGGSPPRLVQFLDRAPSADDVVAQLMMCVSFNAPRRPDLEAFLSGTDQPQIVAALTKQWADNSFLPNEIVTDVGLANPQVEPGGVLLAVAKDRVDLVDFSRAHTADALLRGVRMRRADLAAKFQRVLRELPPGATRERLCEVAAYGSADDPATAAAVEAGYLPERQEDRVVFLFLTEQWEQYDVLDPSGDLLYAAYLAKRSADEHDLASRIIATARRTNRPDPAARYLEENPRPDRTGRHQSPGHYSSDYGFGGDHGAGGFHT